MTEQIRDALLEIHGHLGSALVQSAPSDDEIIIQHIRDADALVLSLLRSGQ